MSNKSPATGQGEDSALMSSIPVLVSAPPPDDFFERFERWVKEKPNQASISFIQNLKFESIDCDFAEMYRLTQCGAAAFRKAGLVAGDRILLELPTNTAFAACILGAFYLGLIPAVIAPVEARTEATAELEWRHHLEMLQPKAVVSHRDSGPGEGVVHLLPKQILVADPSEAGARVSGDEMSYVQFSSGSTGAPKALLLKMNDIVFNLEMMSERIPIHSSDNLFSWLPVYHDMGLFGTFILSLYVGSQLTMADPSLFTRSPMMWFRVMSDRHCNVTVGPPSALSGALHLLERRPPTEGLDLSECSRWLVGAEQVTPNLVRYFEKVTAPYGATATTLKPVYGMAEITLAATMPVYPSKAQTERIQRAPFEQEGLALPAKDDLPEQDVLEWTSCGYALSGQGLRITDDAGNDLSDREIGHVLLSSPSLYAGFLQGDKVIPREGPWHDTGDLGYVADGNLYVTGRIREIIIKNGRNYSPERIEDLAAMVDGVSRGAAFGIFDERRETERVVLYIEVNSRYLRDAEHRDAMRLEIRNSLTSAGFDVDEVHVCRRNSLPRTTSGKIRRHSIRRQHLKDSAAKG